MFDDVDRLREAPTLAQLLASYAAAGAADPQAWQTRCMKLDRVSTRELVKLHGELIAYDWIEQNTGVVPPGLVEVGAGCYRVTPDGFRALKLSQSTPLAEAA